MNNNNNNNNKFLMLFMVNLVSKDNLHKPINLKVKENFFENLRESCEENNINIGICINNFNKIIHGNFNKIPLKTILNICFDDNYYIENNNNFILIKQKELINKIYYVSTYVNKEQLNSIEKFLNEIVKNLGGEFFLNKEDCSIFIRTLEKNHILINNYIEKINRELNQQVILECKIISIQKNKNNNKNLNLLFLGKKLLDNNILDLFNNTFDLMKLINVYKNFLFQDLDDVCNFLSKIYTTDNIFNIKILMYNKQVCEFKTEELRYSGSYYDTKFIDNNEIDYNDNNIENKKVKKRFPLPYMIKNLKSFTSGVNLQIIPYIRVNDIILNINFNKSDFNENKKNQELPYIITNNFTSSIKVNFNEIVILNGLKNTILKKNIKNKTPFRILNFFLSKEEITENECEILFLIKIKRI